MRPPRPFTRPLPSMSCIVAARCLPRPPRSPEASRSEHLSLLVRALCCLRHRIRASALKTSRLSISVLPANLARGARSCC